MCFDLLNEEYELLEQFQSIQKDRLDKIQSLSKRFKKQHKQALSHEKKSKVYKKSPKLSTS